MRRIAPWAIGLVLLVPLASAADKRGPIEPAPFVLEETAPPPPAPGEPIPETPTYPAELPGLKKEENAISKNNVLDRFDLKVPSGWWGPVSLLHGARYERPKTQTSFTVTYRPYSGAGKWSSSSAYRMHLRSQGITTDPHLLSTVRLSGRYASRAQYTSILYGKIKLFNDTRAVYFNEEILLPVATGLYVLHYRAPKEEFMRHRGSYLQILESFSVLLSPEYTPEKYYTERVHLMDPLLDSGISIGKLRYTPVDTYSGNAYQAGFMLGPAGLNAKSSGVPERIFKGGAGSLQLLYYPIDRLALGIETSYARYAPEKQAPNTFEFQSWVFSQVMRINPLGKRRPWTPYLIGTIGSHLTLGKTRIGGGTAWSAGAGLEKRVNKYLSRTIEGRFRHLRLNGPDLYGKLESADLTIGYHLKWGHFRHTEHPVLETRREMGLIRSPAPPWHRRRSRRASEKTLSRSVPAPKETSALRSHPDFSYKVPLGWKGPIEVPGGVRYSGPGGQATFTIVYHPIESPEWMEPEIYRPEMRARGSIADRHVLDSVLICQRFASRARYTTHLYRENEILGDEPETYYTEEIFAPDDGGNYHIQYRARISDFADYHSGYLAFLKSLEFPQKRDYEPSPYYQNRDHILADLFETDVTPRRTTKIDQRLLFGRRFQLGMMTHRFETFGLSLFAAVSNNWSAGLFHDLAAQGDFKSTGLRFRWHSRNTMRNGAYLFLDLSRVTSEFPTEAELDAKGLILLGENTKALFPAIGLGYQWLWRQGFFDLGISQGYPAKFSQASTPTGAPGDAIESHRELRNRLHIIGGMRF